MRRCCVVGCWGCPNSPSAMKDGEGNPVLLFTDNTDRKGMAQLELQKSVKWCAKKEENGYKVIPPPTPQGFRLWREEVYRVREGSLHSAEFTHPCEPIEWSGRWLIHRQQKERLRVRLDQRHIFHLAASMFLARLPSSWCWRCAFRWQHAFVVWRPYCCIIYS